MPGIVRPGIGFGSWHIRIRKDDGLEPYCTTYIEGGQAALAIPSAFIEGRYLRLRRVARPNAEQADLVAAMKLTLPERLCADRDVTDSNSFRLPTERTPRKCCEDF